MTLVKVVPSGTPYSPGTGLTPPTENRIGFKGCITAYVDSNTDNSLVINNLFKAFIPSLNLGVVPEPQDKVETFDGTYTVIEVNKVRFKGQPVTYICKVEA